MFSFFARKPNSRIQSSKFLSTSSTEFILLNASRMVSSRDGLSRLKVTLDETYKDPEGHFE